jgi:GT2 family glycosyltransferase
MSRTMAVLMTCHNRKAMTMQCLANIFDQELPLDYRLAVYLADDGSTDGTREAVRNGFPEVNLIMADGSLFWSGGMHLAWQHAAETDADFYLWMNDDTFLLPGCIRTLERTWREFASGGRERCIVVASCLDPKTGARSYGGENTRDGHPGRPVAVLPDPSLPKVCETFNGNCVLVPKATFAALGIMRKFRHAISDTDYGLLATRKGIPVVIAPGYWAECVLNPVFECPHSAWQDRSRPRAERWRYLVGRRGLPPLDWWRFLWTHAGIRALIYWPIPYAKVLLGL